MARTKQTARYQANNTRLHVASTSGGGGGGKRPGGDDPNRRRGGADKPDAPKSRKHGFCWACGKKGRAFAREVIGGVYEVCSVCIKRCTRLINDRFERNEVRINSN